jgi:hypothetical protein
MVNECGMSLVNRGWVNSVSVYHRELVLVMPTRNEEQIVEYQHVA